MSCSGRERTKDSRACLFSSLSHSLARTLERKVGAVFLQLFVAGWDIAPHGGRTGIEKENVEQALPEKPCNLRDYILGLNVSAGEYSG